MTHREWMSTAQCCGEQEGVSSDRSALSLCLLVPSEALCEVGYNTHMQVSTSLEETRDIAHLFLASLAPGKKATIVALQGDLGAGKTAFTKEAAKMLGVDEVSSPTFVIMKIYEIDFNGFKKFIHIDAYRLEKEYELLHLGWQEMASQPENLIFIEWPENVPGLIDSEARKIDLKFIDEKAREIHIHA